MLKYVALSTVGFRNSSVGNWSAGNGTTYPLAANSVVQTTSTLKTPILAFLICVFWIIC